MTATQSEAKPPAVERLLARVKANDRLPTLGVTVTRILQLARSADGSIAELASMILADVNLTHRVLTLANAAMYRRSVHQPVTTVTRAIVLLGFEQVRLLALGVLMLDKVADPEQASALRYELVRAACASAVARELADRHLERLREEASIAALLMNFGRLMVGALDYTAYRTINARMARGDSEAVASQQVLGSPYSELTLAVLDDMGIPAPLLTTIDSVVQPSSGGGDASGSLPSLVSCAAMLGATLLEQDPGRRENGLQRVLSGPAKAFGFDRARLDAVMVSTLEDLAPLADAMQGVSDPLHGIVAAPGKSFGAVSSGAGRETGAASEGSVPSSQDVDRALAERKPLADAIARLASGAPQPGGLATALRGALDAMRECFSQEHAILLLRDGAFVQARLWSGDIGASLAAAIRCPLATKTDLVGLITARGVDVQLNDLRDGKIASRLPSWIAQFATRPAGMVLMPLHYQDKPIGCLLGLRVEAAAAALSDLELEVLKRLKQQILVSLRTLRV